MVLHGGRGGVRSLYARPSHSFLRSAYATSSSLKSSSTDPAKSKKRATCNRITTQGTTTNDWDDPTTEIFTHILYATITYCCCGHDEKKRNALVYIRPPTSVRAVNLAAFICSPGWRGGGDIGSSRFSSSPKAVRIRLFLPCSHEKVWQKPMGLLVILRMVAQGF